MAGGLPVTVWRDQQGIIDYGSDGVNNIVDIDDNYLVDINGNFVVDTGVTAAMVPATIWSEDDSQ
jgi:hypothetical protein